MSSSELESLKQQLQRLIDVQELQALRCAYFRCLDTANLAELKELLTEDYACRCIGGDYVYEAKSRAEFLEVTANSFHSEIVTQHNGHGAEIELVDATHATGRVYFHDLVYHFRTREFLMGTAVYRDRYRKVDGRWRIEYGEYERVYEVTEILPRAPHFTAHWLGTHGKQLPKGAHYDAVSGRYVE